MFGYYYLCTGLEHVLYIVSISGTCDVCVDDFAPWVTIEGDEFLPNEIDTILVSVASYENKVKFNNY